MSNTTFTANRSASWTIAPMHESAERLYLAAKALRAIEGQSQVAALIGAETPQVVNNWEARGVSKDGALMAQAAIGCDAIWILTGKGSMTPGWPFRISYGRFTALGERAQGVVEGKLIAAIEAEEGTTHILQSEEVKPLSLKPKSGKPQTHRKKA